MRLLSLVGGVQGHFQLTFVVIVGAAGVDVISALFRDATAAS